MESMKHYRESYKGLKLQYLRQPEGHWTWHAERVDRDGQPRIVVYGKACDLGLARTAARADVDAWQQHRSTT